jgi:hypothetical protein
MLQNRPVPAHFRNQLVVVIPSSSIRIISHYLDGSYLETDSGYEETISMQTRISRRRFLALLAAFPVTAQCLIPRLPSKAADLGDDFILVRGWVLKKTDLLDV